jgi:hypothetical protein
MQWHAFLERFSREHRARLATIHGVEQATPVTRVPSAARESVRLERGGPDRILRVSFVNGIDPGEVIVEAPAAR